MMKTKFKKWLVAGLSVFGASLLATAVGVGLASNQKIKQTNFKPKASEFASTSAENNNPYYSNQQILNALNYGSNPNNYFVPLNFNGTNVKYPLATTKFAFNTQANDISMLAASYFKDATSMVSTGSYESNIHLLSFANNQFSNYDWNDLATKLVESSNIDKTFSNMYKNVGGAIASWANFPQGNGTAKLGNGNLLNNTWGWSNTELYGLAYSLGSYTTGPFLSTKFNQINNAIINTNSLINDPNVNWNFYYIGNYNYPTQDCLGVVKPNNLSSNLINELMNYFTNQSNTSQTDFLQSAGSGFGITSSKQNWFNDMNNGSNNPNVSLNINFANTWAKYWQFNANLFLFNNTYNDMQSNTTVAQANNYNNNYANSLANTPISNFYNPASYPTNDQTYFTNPNYTTTPVVLGNVNTSTIFNRINVNLAKLLMIDTKNSSSFYNLNNSINNPNPISAWKNPNDVLLSLGWNTKLMHAIYEASEIAQKLNDFLNENPIWKTSLNTPTYAEPLTILTNGILDGKVSLAALNGWINDVKNNPNNFNHFTYVDENGNTLPIVANQTVNFWNELTQNNINLINTKTTSLTNNIQTIFNWNTFWNYLIKQTFNQDIYVSWSPSYNPDVSFKTCVYTPQNGWSPINAAAQMQASSNQNQINLGIKINDVWFQYPQNLATNAKNDSLNPLGDKTKATITVDQDGLALENIYQTTQEVNKEYAELPQITNSLWTAQNSMTSLNAYNEANPIVYLKNENNEINYLVSFQNALQAQNNYLPTNGTNAAIVKQLNFYNLQIIANQANENKKPIVKIKTNDANKIEKLNTATAVEMDNVTELATAPEKSGIISNWPYYNTDIIGVNMQELLRQKISEALNVPPELLAQQGLPKDFLKTILFLINGFVPNEALNVINEKNISGNYKYTNLNNFYNLWGKLSAKAPNRDDYYSEQDYQTALNQFWAKAKTVNNLNYYYCLAVSPINLLNYLDPSTYASLINNQFLIPAYQTSNGWYGYFVGISSAFKPLNLNVQNNAIVNNVNTSGTTNNLISLNNNVVINTSKLETENINTTASQIKDLSITLQKQQHDLEIALNGGLNNKANGLNQAYTNTVQKIEAYLDNGNNLNLFKETFDNFALAMQKQLQKIIDNFNKVKKQTENVWHGIYIGKKLVFDYHNELLEMQNLINNANNNFKTELIKQGKWQELQNILQTNYLNYVNQLIQTYNSFLNNWETVKKDTITLKTRLNSPVSVMQGSVITFNLKNWATESGNPEIVKNLKNSSEWANPYFNVSENEFLKQINNLLSQNQAKFTLTADDLKNVNNTTETKKWFFDNTNATATLVVGKPKEYLMINDNKVNPIDLNGWNSVNSANGTIDTNNTYVNNLNQLNLAAKNGFEIYTNAESLIVSLNKFNETIANDFNTSRMIINDAENFASVSKPQVNVNNALSEKADNLLLSVLFTNPKINTNQTLLKNINIDNLPEQIKSFVKELSNNPATDATVVNNAVAKYQPFEQDYQHINGGAIAGIVIAVLVVLAVIAGVLWNFFATKKVSTKKEIILSAEDKAALEKIDNEREE